MDRMDPRQTKGKAMLNKTKILTVMCLAVLGLGMTACETVEGAGEDIEHAGDAVQDAAN